MMAIFAHAFKWGLAIALFAGMAPDALGQVPPRASSDGADDARKLFEEGSRLYDLGKYDEAIVRFSHAYDLSGAPSLLLNIAQAYRLKGPETCTQALLFYQRYLDKKPDSPHRAEIDTRIEEMRTCANKTPAEPQSTTTAKADRPAAPAPQPPPESKMNTANGKGPWQALGWTSAAVGVLGVATAAVTAVLALRLEGKLGSACTSEGACPRTEADRIQSYKALRTTAIVSAIIGGVGAGGAVFFFSKSASTNRENVGAFALGRGGYIGVRGQF